jgi:hypothetical protein
MLYYVYQSRYLYGGPFPGTWVPIGAYKRIEDVETLLKLKKAIINKFETRYETAPDEMGCFDMYRVEVQL